MNKIQWTIEQLEIFVASVEQGSFSAAARQLRIAQSKVSNSVSDLELILGVELFFRTKKLPIPTAEGKRFYDYAKSIIAKCLQTNSDMINISFGMEASLSIAIEDGVPLDRIDKILKELSAVFPYLSLTIINSTHKEIINLLICKEVDLAITISPSYYPDLLENQHFGHVKQLLVVSKKHPLSKIESPTIADLSNYREIRFISDINEKQYASSTWHLTSYFNISGVVSLGIGWSVIPESVFNLMSGINDGLVSINNNKLNTTLPLEIKLIKHIEYVKGPVMQWIYDKFKSHFNSNCFVTNQDE
ncbi:LysR family transcriptional regulator [Aliivibrio sp. S3MY1]|uniref:LysR family transcriptional regulator n=1 Tax=Aliivibrio sp. S3MY1 TaxID=3028424 RepID=UPI0023781BD0|nr:LysR family transcriptional regulator [Aliivibrio sp. S3MY1]MDD9195022.1 LysR family transcriptional regulator [Aliivibrio sp. S3MY1]